MDRLRDLPPDTLPPQQREALRTLKLLGPLRESEVHQQRLWRTLAAMPGAQVPPGRPLRWAGAAVALAAAAATAGYLARGWREPPAAPPPEAPAIRARPAPPPFRVDPRIET